MPSGVKQMMNREKRVLCIFAVFTALSLAYSAQVNAGLPSCTKYQFINVKIAPEDAANPRSEQFHGIPSGGQHESFNLPESWPGR